MKEVKDPRVPCQECGTMISRFKAKQKDGYCDSCFAKKLNEEEEDE